MKGDWVEIFDWQREVKANYPTEESARAVVKEILDHINETGRPDTSRHHTHTPPPRGANVRYIAEFDLPKRFLQRKSFAPCAACSPNHQKFGRGGKIAYFPDEQVIRIIGPECFYRFNAEGHITALKDWRHEVSVRRDTNYLLTRYHDIPQTLRAIDHAIPCADAVDDIRRRLRDAAQEVLQYDLWELFKDGSLKITEAQTEHYRLRDGQEGSRQITIQRVYGPLAGYTMLAPRRPRIAPRLRECERDLRAIYDDSVIIEDMTDEWRLQTAQLLRQSLRTAHNMWQEIEELRRFISPLAIGSLNGWSKHPGCPVKICVRFSMGRLFIGTDAENGRIIPVPGDAHRVLRALPNVAADLAAE